MRRLLITGGTGFIGTNFVRYWIRQHGGDFVVVLDALTYAANRENLGQWRGTRISSLCVETYFHNPLIRR